MFEREARRVADQIRAGSDRLRELGRKAAPGVWRALPGEDVVQLLGRDNEQIAVLTGLWAPGTAAYLTAVAPSTAYNIAELLWLSESVIRKGEMPYRVKEALLNLANGVP